MTAICKPRLKPSEEAKIELARRALARRNLFEFTKYTMPEFEATKFHETYYRVLDKFAKKEIYKLMVTIPPQHGKSEGSSRRLPAFIHGRNPDAKIGILSYAASLAQSFNRDNQRIVLSGTYHKLFPKTTINGSEYTSKEPGNRRNSTIFDIVGCRGFLKAVGRSGALTGDPLDIAIMDDLYKDLKEGNSPVIRRAVIEWYNSVVKKRLHNESQQLIVFTRWHAEDLIGYLEERENVVTVSSWAQLENPDKDIWYKINFPALMDSKPTELDPREMGEALYPEKHNKKKLEDEKLLDPVTFQSLNQGDPTPKEGLLYASGFKTYKRRPQEFKKLGNYTDVADTGSDYLCSINYGVGLDDYIYILDVYYTQDPQEITEEATAKFLKRSFIRESKMESNNGGRGFARNVDRFAKYSILIETFHQGDNKESRILTNSAEAVRKILFPAQWQSLWPIFAKHILRFKRVFNANEHDDAPDALTGVLEHSGVSDMLNLALYRK